MSSEDERLKRLKRLKKNNSHHRSHNQDGDQRVNPYHRHGKNDFRRMVKGLNLDEFDDLEDLEEIIYDEFD